MRSEGVFAMIDIIERYQASIFLNAADITPSPDNVTTLVNIFRDRELIPNTFYEFKPPSLLPQPRLRFSNLNSEWIINIGTERIDIEKHPTDPKGNNLGDLSKFCTDAMGMFTKIIEKYNKKSNRLALIANYIMQEMTETHFAKAYTNLFKSSDFYVTNPPFEWNWRAAARIRREIRKQQEAINVVATVIRAKMDYRFKEEVKQIDRLALNLDINTSPENSEFRFDLTHAESFYHEATQLNTRLITELPGFINA